VLIRCTHRLLKNVEVAGEQLPASAFLLGEWYANAVPLPFRGRWLVLFVHASTLLTVLLPGRSLRATLPAFRPRVAALLQRLGASPGWIAQHWHRDEHVTFGRTADRRVVGTMNELAFQAQTAAEWAGSFDQLDFTELELQLAETPLSLIRYAHPAGVAQKLFSGVPAA